MPTNRTQTLIWTALPNGYRTDKTTGKQYLRLSIFLSPRLETIESTGTLDDYPDFANSVPLQNWAASVNALTWKVQTAVAETNATTWVTYETGVTKTSPSAEPALWDSFFKPTLPIKKPGSGQHVFRDFSAANMKTFSNAGVYSTVKKQYATIASLPARNYTKPTLASLINLPNVTNPPMVSVLPTALIQSSGVAALAGASAAAAQHPTFTAFEDFHTPYPVPAGFVAPVRPFMDFHRAMSALSNYPALLRRLGIVVDIEVPYTAAMSKATRIRVIPTWPLLPTGQPRLPRGSVVYAEDQQPVTHIDGLQWTAYEMRLTTTLPAKVTRFQTASKNGKVKDGYLVVRSITNAAYDPVRLFNVDVDLAATKMMATAVSAASLLNRADAMVVNQSARTGENVADGKARASAVEAVAASETMALPPLGQPVIRMAMVDLATRIKSQMQTAAVMNARLMNELEVQNVNYMEDVTRGYRVDAWDSVTRQWHRLCGRVGTYSIGGAPIPWGTDSAKSDEGWVQLGGVSAPGEVLTDDPPTEMRIHESVFDWSGWSLAVPRPGKALSEPDGDGVSTPTKTFTDPEGGTTDLGHYLHPDLPLDVRWAVPAGDLPRLRFGTTYRFRARAVDLAGNSLGFSKGSTTADPGGTGDSSPYVTRALVHKRFDPVKPPTIVPVAAPKPSESPAVLVVRSYHRPDSHSDIITENTARHITPPRTAVTMAEACWGLDSSATGKPMNKAMWEQLKTRDAWDAPQAIPPGKTQPEALPQATFPSPVPYLPDRYARGAAFKRLPGVASTLTTRSVSTSAKVSGVRVPLSSTQSTTVASFRVSFEKSGPWYERVPFKFDVRGIEGTDARLASHDLPAFPVWGETQRVLRVELPKADEYTVEMSSYLNGADLKVMGVHQWSMEQFKPSLALVQTLPMTSASASASAPASNLVPTAPSTTLSTSANAVIAASLIGQNWMVSPSQKVTLVHAVDEPMIRPAFTTRAHMERKPGETHATLVDWMPIHGKSTSKVDVDASWTENVDDLDDAAPKVVSKKASVFSLTVPRTQTTILNVGQSTPKMASCAWGVIPATGMLVNKSTVNTKPQRHFLGDTKHKVIKYKTTYASRYEKYFADIDGLTFALTSTEKSLHVPSSARPAPPVIDYIVPTFGWSRSGSSSVRYGGGLRVYLDRPWYSSGDGELLGVVLYQPAAYNAGFANLEPYVTRWGNDPLWTSSGVLPTSLPAYSRFTKRIRTGTNLHLREWSSNHVIAVGHKVEYDTATRRWFADIAIDQGKAYFPFVKLALVRYQPYSLPGYELSSVVKADFVQLTPNRWAAASVVHVRGGHNVTCTMTGQTYSGSDAGTPAIVKVQVQKRLASAEADLGWTSLGSELTMVKQSRTAAQIITGDTRTTWKRAFLLTETPVEGTAYRALIREYEVYHNYTGTTSPTTANRLVYAEAIPLSL